MIATVLAWMTATHVLQVLSVWAAANIVLAPAIARVPTTTMVGKVVHIMGALGPADIVKALQVWQTIGKALAVPLVGACFVLMLAACTKAPANPPPAFVTAEQSCSAAEKILASCATTTALSSLLQRSDWEATTLNELAGCSADGISVVRTCWDARKTEMAALATIDGGPPADAGGQ